MSDAFEKFVNLSDSTRRDFAVITQLDSCVMFRQALVVKKGEPYKPQQNSYEQKLWLLMVDMRNIDLEKTHLNGKSTQIVMTRGHEINVVEQTARVYGIGTPIGIENIRIVMQKRPPDAWHGYFSEELPRLLHFKPREGWKLEGDTTIDADNFIRIHRTNPGDLYKPVGRVEKDRSVDWRFSGAFPEDAVEIHAAFIDLVKACQA